MEAIVPDQIRYYWTSSVGGETERGKKGFEKHLGIYKSL